MVILSTRITNKNKENAHLSLDGTKRSIPRKRTHVQDRAKTCLVPAPWPESLCSLLKENCSLTKNLSRGVDNQRKLRLPKTLRRPIFRPIASQCLTAIDPGLLGVPLEYIEQELKEKSEKLYKGTLKILPKQTVYSDGLSNQRTMEITVLDDSIELPTHIVAVYASAITSNGSSKKHVSFHPAHSIVLATQCAHLPPVHSPELLPSISDKKILILPILPMCLPSPVTFPLLLRYLYVHRSSEMLSALFPFSTQNLSNNEVSSKLVSCCSAPALLSLISAVHGLWSNVAALGIFEKPLWEVLDFSWEVLLEALESKTKPKENA